MDASIVRMCLERRHVFLFKVQRTFGMYNMYIHVHSLYFMGAPSHHAMYLHVHVHVYLCMLIPSSHNINVPTYIHVHVLIYYTLSLLMNRARETKSRMRASQKSQNCWSAMYQQTSCRNQYMRGILRYCSLVPGTDTGVWCTQDAYISTKTRNPRPLFAPLCWQVC